MEPSKNSVASAHRLLESEAGQDVIEYSLIMAFFLLLAVALFSYNPTAMRHIAQATSDMMADAAAFANSR